MSPDSRSCSLRLGRGIRLRAKDTRADRRFAAKFALIAALITLVVECSVLFLMLPR